MSSKKAKQQQNDDLDAFLDQAIPKKTFTADLVFFYGSSALLAAAAPAWLFYSLFHMQGVEYYPVFGVVSVIVVALLCMAYHTTNTNLYVKLMSNRPEVQKPIGQSDADKSKSAKAELARSYTSSEGLSHAILYNTLLYVGIFVTLGFFVLGRLIPAVYTYPASTVGAAALVLLASRTKQ